MASSYSMDDFLGDGVLRELVPKLVGGWDDVPTLKLMNSEDMDSLKMTQRQKDALELRSYLHDRSLMEYADRLEASEKPLAELLAMNQSILSSQFGMKRGHAARFADQMPPASPVHPAREKSMQSMRKSMEKNEKLPARARKMQYAVSSAARGSSKYEMSIEKSMANFKLSEGHVFAGIVASEPAESRLCGCIRPPPVVGNVSPYYYIENISVQKLAPEYKIGSERLVKMVAPPMKALELWCDKPVILLCIRRPGCIMCRAAAYNLYAKKPIFDVLGIQLIAVVHETIQTEVRDFWPRYWGGALILDQGMDFFKALGGGELMKDQFFTGFLLNPRAIANYKRAKATGLESNFKGKGEVKGGMFIVGSGQRGIVYQFIERTYGDWAPIAEVIEICSRLQSGQPSEDAQFSTVNSN